MKIRCRPRALADIDEIFNFTNTRSPAGARNVLHVLAEAVDEIGAHPLACLCDQAHSALADTFLGKELEHG